MLFGCGYAQHTVAYKSPLSIQRGFLVGFSHKIRNTHTKWEFTTYVFNPGVAGTPEEPIVPRTGEASCALALPVSGSTYARIAVVSTASVISFFIGASF
jgi:hypothetical protein